MLQKIFIIIGGLLIGLFGGYFFKLYSPALSQEIVEEISTKHIIGFMPYWLTEKAKKDYSPYITTLTYFSLTLNGDGTIMKLANEQEEEPGWYALRSGKMDSLFAEAKQKGLTLSLLVFSADQATIDGLISNPKEHAKNVVSEVAPIMKKYGFTDLNLDIESVTTASEEARTNFTQFIHEIRNEINNRKMGTLTIDVSPTALYKDYLIDPKQIAPLVDYMVFMTYDYHYQGSSVTGPVAPLAGGGTISEFDVEVSMKDALKIMPADKIIMGIPLYGYEWETIDNTPRSAVIPGTGITASNARVETLIEDCTTCSIKFDDTAKESYLIYKDEETDVYHQIFYPDKKSMQVKTQFAQTLNLGGVAVWALGYEGKTILDPLADYK